MNSIWISWDFRPWVSGKVASGFLTFNRLSIKKLFCVARHAKSIANLCKLSHLCSHWIFPLFLCTPYPNLGKLTIIRWGCQWAKYRDLSVANRTIICRSRRLKQIIDDLFYHRFDHRICFLMNSGNEAICHFHARAITRRRKAWFHLRMSRISTLAKLSQTQLDDIAHEQTHYLSSDICRSRGGLSANEKEETFASNNNIDDHALPVQKAG